MQDEGARLYRRFINGDEQSFEDIFALYFRGLFYFVYGYVRDRGVAEDIAQETLSGLWAKPRFSERDGASLKAYLYEIAKNKSLNVLKRQKRRREISLETLDHEEPCLQELDGEEARERARRVRKAMNELGDEYRETLYMRYFQDMPPQDIAKRTGKSVKKVYNLLARGKARLRVKLTE